MNLSSLFWQCYTEGKYGKPICTIHVYNCWFFLLLVPLWSDLRWICKGSNSSHIFFIINSDIIWIFRLIQLIWQFWLTAENFPEHFSVEWLLLLFPLQRENNNYYYNHNHNNNTIDNNNYNWRNNATTNYKCQLYSTTNIINNN